MQRFEPGETVNSLKKLFEVLKKGLGEILEVTSKIDQPNKTFLYKEYPIDKQIEFDEAVKERKNKSREKNYILLVQNFCCKKKVFCFCIIIPLKQFERFAFTKRSCTYYYDLPQTSVASPRNSVLIHILETFQASRNRFENILLFKLFILI